MGQEKVDSWAVVEEVVDSQSELVIVLVIVVAVGVVVVVVVVVAVVVAVVVVVVAAVVVAVVALVFVVLIVFVFPALAVEVVGKDSILYNLFAIEFLLAYHLENFFVTLVALFLAILSFARDPATLVVVPCLAFVNVVLAVIPHCFLLSQPQKRFFFACKPRGLHQRPFYHVTPGKFEN